MNLIGKKRSKTLSHLGTLHLGIWAFYRHYVSTRVFYHLRDSGTRRSLALKELKERTQAIKISGQLKTLGHLGT